VPVFEVLAPRNKHFEKLQNLVDVIPDIGFPVKIGVYFIPFSSSPFRFFFLSFFALLFFLVFSFSFFC